MPVTFSQALEWAQTACSGLPFLKGFVSCLLGAEEHASQEEEDDPALVANVAAQKHFRQQLRVITNFTASFMFINGGFY
ncbi:hypothetical protein GW17_00062342 [Ensete ventricosum]|nr:hypothetical protein GW17_00062342 [Ensete ventricosum]